ncbi:MAG: hypothetical protein U9R21_06445, partial [Candidatus Thermoplasmatota archaeon]|nr:hypothetical protein [Candidatus Thermoplasmatota archaeon]
LGKTYPVKYYISLDDTPSDNDSEEDYEQDSNDTDQESDDEKEDEDLLIPIKIVHPSQKRVYFLDKQTRIATNKLIIIGKITIQVDCLSNVDKVLFIKDNQILGEDCKSPFICTINERHLLAKESVIIKGYDIKDDINSSYVEDLIKLLYAEFSKYVQSRSIEQLYFVYEIYLQIQNEYINAIYETQLDMIYCNLFTKY